MPGDPVDEWRFGGITLRRGADALRPCQTSLSRGMICVILSRNGGRCAGDMGLTICTPEICGPDALHSGPDAFVLMVSDVAGAGEVTPRWQGMVRVDAARGPGAILAHHIRQLSEQIAQVPQDRLESLALATRALVGICLAPPEARPCVGQACAEQPCAPSALVERARHGVRRNMASVEFGPAELARLLAMSRSKLYRVLLPEGGVAHFINRERLLQARRELAADETASIHAIAARVGFKDHSTFSRAFRRAFGVTPTQTRMNAPIRLQASRAPRPAGRGRAQWVTEPAMLALTMPENGMISPDLGFWADTARKQC
jgi:AraC-like DNA-binding protein